MENNNTPKNRTYNEQYMKNMENTDFQLLEDFNEKKLKLKNLGRTTTMSSTDASGHTKDNKTVNIELKKRELDMIHTDSGWKIKGNGFTASTIIIEGHKAASMYFAYSSKKQVPAYINFLKNGYVVLFDLTKLSYEVKETKEQKIKSKGYGQIEIGRRFKLDLKDAWIFQKVNDKYKTLQKGWD